LTLSPVFRSHDAVRLLVDGGVLDLLGPALVRQLAAVRRVWDDLPDVVGPDSLAAASPDPPPVEALQRHFFLTLFLAAFEHLGVAPARLDFYAELDFCLVGTVTAADDLFDDEAKTSLPLAEIPGARLRAILELMCFERLRGRVGARAARSGAVDAASFAGVEKALLDEMVSIGRLEGSEEAGVARVVEPEGMLESVHAVRGGRLFGLAMVAPSRLETGTVRERLVSLGPALGALGTAFQVVDDLVDFEVDLARRSHNLLLSWAWHRGPAGERAAARRLWAGEGPLSGAVEARLPESAAAVLGRARELGRRAFEGLSDLGFAFPRELSDAVVHAIVGEQGVSRMAAIAGMPRPRGPA